MITLLQKISQTMTRIVLVLLTLACLAEANFNANCFGNRKAIVHLFEWRWADIANECEQFLSVKGFCGVQVSPPNENRVVTDPMRPWWERYQPVSYKTYSRSGDEAAFIDMVRRCNDVGVRIYVDALLNHMAGADAGSGTGIGGSYYDAPGLNFPEVPWTSSDFNQQGVDCHTSSGNIENYGDAEQVRNCRLVSLVDLKQSESNVRNTLASWLNRLIGFGVAGFRLDASKHIWPGDIQAIIGKLNNLPTQWFQSGSKPFIYQEVIDLGGEPIKSSEYYSFAKVTEFNYGKYLSEAFSGRNQLKNFKTFGEGWGYLMPDNAALVFIDNHDNQRGHGAGGSILSFSSPRNYKMAVSYMLAWPYGQPRVMSSYYWDEDWVGPPADSNYNTKPVTINDDGSCGNGWVCEHRWKPISDMVRFSNIAGKEAVEHWWDDGDYQVAFSRGNKAFFAVNAGNRHMQVQVQTNMKAGRYCDIISGELASNGQSCTGKSILIDSNAKASVSISNSEEEPMIAIHIDSYLSDDTDPDPWTTSSHATPGPTPGGGYQRTVIFIYFQSEMGQNLFVRGGISTSRWPSCHSSPSDCFIPISYSHVSYPSGHYDAYNAWSQGDQYLDWNGAESGQGSYMSSEAQGSPMAWTTNSPMTDSGYNSLNTYGMHYWMLDVSMDCSSSDNGWFELKAILNNNWEFDIHQSQSCSGTGQISAPFTSNNHIAKCGYKNVFRYGESSCQIDSF